MTEDTTIRQLEERLSVPVQENVASSPLGEWYHSVRDKRLSDLSVDDLCIALRQELFLDSLLPVIVDRFEKDPLAGEQYDGELLVSLIQVPQHYWIRFPDMGNRIREAIFSIRSNVNGDLAADVASLLRKLPGAGITGTA